jgi:hypothetical protein
MRGERYSWLRHCATRREVQFPVGSLSIFKSDFSSPESTLTETSTKEFPLGLNAVGA